MNQHKTIDAITERDHLRRENARLQDELSSAQSAAGELERENETLRYRATVAADHYAENNLSRCISSSWAARWKGIAKYYRERLYAPSLENRVDAAIENFAQKEAQAEGLVDAVFREIGDCEC